MNRCKQGTAPGHHQLVYGDNPVTSRTGWFGVAKPGYHQQTYPSVSETEHRWRQQAIRRTRMPPNGSRTSPRPGNHLRSPSPNSRPTGKRKAQPILATPTTVRQTSRGRRTERTAPTTDRPRARDARCVGVASRGRVTAALSTGLWSDVDRLTVPPPGTTPPESPTPGRDWEERMPVDEHRSQARTAGERVLE
jgi:hypothetical protein